MANDETEDPKVLKKQQKEQWVQERLAEDDWIYTGW